MSSCAGAVAQYEQVAADASHRALRQHVQTIADRCNAAARLIDATQPRYSGDPAAVLQASGNLVHAALQWSKSALASGNYTADTSAMEAQALRSMQTLQSMNMARVVASLEGEAR
jgi:hypothetical protein